MGAISSEPRDLDWVRLHHPDGTHRGTARSANGRELEWFEENKPLHMERHAMENDAWAHSHDALRRLPQGHRLYARIVKTDIVSGAAHVIVRYPHSVVGDMLSIKWVDLNPETINCERSPEAGAYVLNEIGIEAKQEIVHRIGEAVHGDRDYFTCWSL